MKEIKIYFTKSSNGYYLLKERLAGPTLVWDEAGDRPGPSSETMILTTRASKAMIPIKFS